MSGEVEFDRIAPVYDETREPPSEEEVRTLAGILAGCRTILDAGVGTGRFAVPLRAHDFEVLGVDLSLEMMRRARAKGVATLVRADLRHLPFSNQIVDAAFMAHVLQLVPDPRSVLGELGRVARHWVVIVLPEWSERGRTGAVQELQQRYRELAAELGYSLPERGTRYWHTLEELAAIAPPKTVQAVSGPPSTTLTSEERMARWGTRMYGRGQVPPEVHAEIIRRIRTEHPVDLSVWTRPRNERFVAWDPIDLRGIT
ncbi:MAG: class I SAM-dependent methyltransferase [Thermoplasmata archaeon]